ncbi:hypothetical protein AWU65_01260 [Paenibacillus glucanolyticus]|uniref:HTH lysR-type domain-containing protein n=1 Tax=Paenibacillus glucanolyticus TaxID=59843 RepID=A0A163DJX9_9BACL|nr:LysR family transcriptional regulator [Paenibacillus glucanolyticus]KZS43277.1 hypothetical protein AWU65_01260 [Paenibacillus glucanolyticus]
MNLDQLHYVVEVAKTKSLLAAANQLHVTQSAISQSISSLEAELGVKLFNRSRTGTVPTPEGLIMIKKILQIEQILQEIKDEAKHQSEISGGTLRIAAIPGAMSTLVRTVSSLKKDYPSVHFRMYENNSEEIVAQIRQNQIDIGLVLATPDSEKKELEGLRFEPLWKGKIAVGVWRNSPLTSMKSVTPDELIKFPFVLYDEGYIHEFIRHFSKTFGPVNTLFTSNNATAIVNALQEELAVTVAFDFSFFANPLVVSGDLIMIEIDRFEQQSATLGWIRSENNKNSLVSKHFINRFVHKIRMGHLL